MRAPSGTEDPWQDSCGLRGAAWHHNGQTDATCGTCHGLPPGEDTGHTQVSLCSGCHPSVVDADFDFVDTSLHNNGHVDF